MLIDRAVSKPTKLPIDIFWYKSIKTHRNLKQSYFPEILCCPCFFCKHEMTCQSPRMTHLHYDLALILVWSSFYRVLFVNFVALFWNVYLAWKSEASHRKYQPDVHMRQDVWCIWTMYPYHVLKASLNMSDSGVTWKLKFILQNFLYNLFNDCSNFISFARGRDMICYLKC